MKKSQILALILMLFAFSHSQCITVRQRTARHPFVHYSALILCTFSLFRCGNLYFFMFHFFYVALVSCCTFLILHHFYVALFLCSNLFMLQIFFRVPLFLCIALFHVALLHVAMFSCYILLLLHS